MATLLKNPGFEMPALPPTANPQKFAAGPSAGSNWTTYNNSEGITTTDILPSTRPGGGKQMIHVCTTGTNNGLVQAFLPLNSGPEHTRSSVWVFVLRGKVGIGTGNGGNTGIDAQSTATGRWEELKAANGGKPVNEFIVYSLLPDGACYYIDDATVLQAHG